jgi:hypothetical protein
LGIRATRDAETERGHLLESWKEIAAHLNRNIRTCQLWERYHGLPVHRLDGSSKARVFAYPAELDRWLDEKLHEREPGAAGRQAEHGRKGGKARAGLPTLPRWNIGVIAGLAVLAAAAIGTSAWLIRRQARVHWANDIAIPEIERLLFMTSENQGAFDLARRVEKLVPRSPRIARIMLMISGTLTVETDPPGADLYIRPYGGGDRDWELLGRTPLRESRMAQGYKHWRIEKPGYAAAEGGVYVFAGQGENLRLALDERAEAPEGMVRVSGETHGLPYHRLLSAPAVKLKDFWIDRCEVTNRQYQAFVDAGGYRDRQFWNQEFKKDGRPLSWEEVMRTFVDRTGRPGPATWELGVCPLGREDYPVTGVSWYEAAAYAKFVGKRLPSAYHWNFAAGTSEAEFVIPLSNIEGKSMAAVGIFKGLGYFGTYDMAGNAKEWCSNEVEGKRACLGGAWNEAQYWFMNFDAYPPFMRSDNFGFRCMKTVRDPDGTEGAHGPLKLTPEPDYAGLKPCSDDVFEAYRALYSFTKTALDARVESRQDWSEDTAVEKVSFADAEGTDRIIVYLFLPRSVRPPFQSVVHFPGSGANVLESVFDYGQVRNREVELFTRGGRAFVFPVFWNTFERRVKSAPERTRQFLEGRMIRHHRELVRCLDYLETRPDFDKDRFAYQGLSWGAWSGPLHVALEKRFKAANFLGGGFYWEMYHPERGSSDWDVVNFAPHVTTPVLMQNGQFDAYFELETNVRPLFRLLGTPEKDKTLRVYPSGHSVWLLSESRKDMFDFLDRYLGPARR